MTDEKLETMARQAGPWPESGSDSPPDFVMPWLARFAALVRADERERCALVADSMKWGRPGHTAGFDATLYKGDVAAAIRALKNPA